jgi:hypothetical protein
MQTVVSYDMLKVKDKMSVFNKYQNNMHNKYEIRTINKRKYIL